MTVISYVSQELPAQLQQFSYSDADFYLNPCFVYLYLHLFTKFGRQITATYKFKTFA